MSTEPKRAPLTIRTIDEILAMPPDPDLAKVVVNSQNQTVTLNFQYPYEIDLDRIRNERDLLAWTLHLAEKNWMTNTRLCYFIRAVAKEKNLDIFGL